MVFLFLSKFTSLQVYLLDAIYTNTFEYRNADNGHGVSIGELNLAMMINISVFPQSVHEMNYISKQSFSLINFCLKTIINENQLTLLSFVLAAIDECF